MSERELRDVWSPTALGSPWKETELLASAGAGKNAVQGQWNETEFSLYRYTPNFHYEMLTAEPFPSSTASAEAAGGGEERGAGFR
jgi:hypothetical protein